MKLATFSTANAPMPQVGVVVGGHIYPLAHLLPQAPGHMVDLMSDWGVFAPLVEQALGRQDETGIAIENVHLHAPVLRPGKVMALGLNYADHIAETGRDMPTDQTWFCKQPTAVNGPFDVAHIPAVSHKVDYEVELVAIIGKKGRHINREKAPEHVFGFAVGNDITVRDWQRKTTQWVLGKSFDTHAPFGPWVVTLDEIGDPHHLNIRSSVNGELRQNSNTKNMVFDVWAQIAHISQAMTLEPGDVLFTGTPAGVGIGFTPPRFLQAGDVVRCEIEKIGAIENTFVAEKQA